MFWHIIKILSVKNRYSSNSLDEKITPKQLHPLQTRWKLFRNNSTPFGATELQFKLQTTWMGEGGGGSVPDILCLFLSESSQGTDNKNAVKGEAKIIYNSFTKITIQLWNQSLSSLYGRRRSEHSFLNFVTSEIRKRGNLYPVWYITISRSPSIQG